MKHPSCSQLTPPPNPNPLGLPALSNSCVFYCILLDRRSHRFNNRTQLTIQNISSLHSSIPTMSSPNNTPTTPRRTRRTRANSSLEGMMLPDESTPIAELLPTISDDSHTERQELREISLRLRRTKRRLLLKSTEQPSNNVDRLREILLQLSVDSSSDDYPKSSNSTRSRSSSLGSSSNSLQ